MRLRDLKNLKRSTEKAAIKRNEASEKLVEAIDRPEEKMRAFNSQMVDRGQGRRSCWPRLSSIVAILGGLSHSSFLLVLIGLALLFSGT